MQLLQQWGRVEWVFLCEMLITTNVAQGYYKILPEMCQHLLRSLGFLLIVAEADIAVLQDVEEGLYRAGDDEVGLEGLVSEEGVDNMEEIGIDFELSEVRGEDEFEEGGYGRGIKRVIKFVYGQETFSMQFIIRGRGSWRVLQTMLN